MIAGLIAQIKIKQQPAAIKIPCAQNTEIICFSIWLQGFPFAYYILKSLCKILLNYVNLYQEKTTRKCKLNILLKFWKGKNFPSQIPGKNNNTLEGGYSFDSLWSGATTKLGKGLQYNILFWGFVFGEKLELTKVTSVIIFTHPSTPPPLPPQQNFTLRPWLYTGHIISFTKNMLRIARYCVE